MKSLRLLGSLTTVLACAAMAGAATINVGPARTYTTVQAGINAASSGDTILIDVASYAADSATAAWTKDNLTIKAGPPLPSPVAQMD